MCTASKIFKQGLSTLELSLLCQPAATSDQCGISVSTCVCSAGRQMCHSVNSAPCVPMCSSKVDFCLRIENKLDARPGELLLKRI